MNLLVLVVKEQGKFKFVIDVVEKFIDMKTGLQSVMFVLMGLEFVGL